MAELDNWLAWIERCALERCPDTTRAALRMFAQSRFLHFATAYAGGTNACRAAVVTPPPREAWHLFESHCELRNTRSGKSYKHWLLARADAGRGPDLNAIQGGATLIMRDVVRDTLRRERSPRWMVSGSTPVGGRSEPGAPTLEELLPAADDTRTAVEEREMAVLARREAAELNVGLSCRHRVVLAAYWLGLSFADPFVEQAAGCGKTRLFKEFPLALRRVGLFVRGRHAGEDRAYAARLAVRVLDELRKIVLAQEKEEKRLSRFFNRVEGAAVEPAAEAAGD